MSLPTIRRGRAGLGALALVALAVAACSAGAALAPEAKPVDGARAGSGAANGGTSYGSDTGAGAPNGGTSGEQAQHGLYDVSRPDLLIIKTGSLGLQVSGIDAALASASAKIAALGGYVSGSDRSGDGDAQTANVTYRIPASQWDAALVALRGLAIKVLGESTQTQDVTGDVLDLGARITNLQATEAALQAIMAKATRITDVLDVQAQLTDVRGQIEQLSTERKHLQEQASYSTLTVTYSLKPEAAVLLSQKGFDPTSEVDQASASLIGVLQGLATAGIWFAIVWLPILLVLGIVLGVVAMVVRRLRRNRPSSGPVLPAASEG
jgi:Domain of unknown function (DUF4349)